MYGVQWNCRRIMGGPNNNPTRSWRRTRPEVSSLWMIGRTRSIARCFNPRWIMSPKSLRLGIDRYNLPHWISCVGCTGRQSMLAESLIFDPVDSLFQRHVRGETIFAASLFSFQTCGMLQDVTQSLERDFQMTYARFQSHIPLDRVGSTALSDGE